MDEISEWLNSQKCEVCGAHADHRQAGRILCNKHMDPNGRAFALND